MLKFDTETETRTKMFNKRSLQATLKQFRQAGYYVVKRSHGYDVLDDDRLIFQALNGAIHCSCRWYLVRLDKQLLAEETA